MSRDLRRLELWNLVRAGHRAVTDAIYVDAYGQPPSSQMFVAAIIAAILDSEFPDGKRLETARQTAGAA